MPDEPATAARYVRDVLLNEVGTALLAYALRAGMSRTYRELVFEIRPAGIPVGEDEQWAGSLLELAGSWAPQPTATRDRRPDARAG